MLGKYEASLGRALNQRGKPGSQCPAMDIWAMALGVDIEHSKATDRVRRKVQLEEAGHSTEPGRWTPSVPPPTAPYQSVLGNRRRKRGRAGLGGSAGSRRSPVVPEVTALDGFLLDLQQRLNSVEGGAVRSSHSTMVPPRAYSVGSGGNHGGGATRVPKRVVAGAGVDDQHNEAVAESSTSLVDVYGIPQAFVVNAEEVREFSVTVVVYICSERACSERSAISAGSRNLVSVSHRQARSFTWFQSTAESLGALTG